MQKTYTEVPLSRPVTPLLDAVNAPADLRKLTAEELIQLTDELRSFMLFCVGKTGGHFGAARAGGRQFSRCASAIRLPTHIERAGEHRYPLSDR